MNDAHKILKTLQQDFEVFIITQNINSLHKLTGSAHILHLHSELLEVCQ
ncbi:MAG: Sir2 family NAD-dependent protein deacetylase [Flavobacteriales bacterium]